MDAATRSYMEDIIDNGLSEDFTLYDMDTIIEQINGLVAICHGLAVRAGWYSNPDGSRKQMNFGERIALIHSELSEALEGHRKNLMDNHLPKHKMAEVEFADVLIRLFDTAGDNDFNLGKAFVDKLLYNQIREDHKMHNRIKDGGKAY